MGSILSQLPSLESFIYGGSYKLNIPPSDPEFKTAFVLS